MVGRPRTTMVAIVSPTARDIAWAAGLYEGEGYCGFSNRTMKLALSQKDPWILHRLRCLFGGSVWVNPTEGTGRVSQWRIFGARAHGFALTIYSYLSPRRRIQVTRMLATTSPYNNWPQQKARRAG